MFLAGIKCIIIAVVQVSVGRRVPVNSLFHNSASGRPADRLRRTVHSRLRTGSQQGQNVGNRAEHDQRGQNGQEYLEPERGPAEARRLRHDSVLVRNGPGDAGGHVEALGGVVRADEADAVLFQETLVRARVGHSEAVDREDPGPGVLSPLHEDLVAAAVLRELHSRVLPVLVVEAVLGAVEPGVQVAEPALVDSLVSQDAVLRVILAPGLDHDVLAADVDVFRLVVLVHVVLIPLRVHHGAEVGRGVVERVLVEVPVVADEDASDVLVLVGDLVVRAVAVLDSLHFVRDFEGAVLGGSQVGPGVVGSVDVADSNVAAVERRVDDCCEAWGLDDGVA